ncbi:unnamed protein product, partial [Amoebophrya sp. A120]|eukprot:GSA120T00015790001.1
MRNRKRRPFLSPRLSFLPTTTATLLFFVQWTSHYYPLVGLATAAATAAGEEQARRSTEKEKDAKIPYQHDSVLPHTVAGQLGEVFENRVDHVGLVPPSSTTEASRPTTTSTSSVYSDVLLSGEGKNNNRKNRPSSWSARGAKAPPAQQDDSSKRSRRDRFRREAIRSSYNRRAGMVPLVRMLGNKLFSGNFVRSRGNSWVKKTDHGVMKSTSRRSGDEIRTTPAGRSSSAAHDNNMVDFAALEKQQRQKFAAGPFDVSEGHNPELTGESELSDKPHQQQQQLPSEMTSKTSPVSEILDLPSKREMAVKPPVEKVEQSGPERRDQIPTDDAGSAGAVFKTTRPNAEVAHLSGLEKAKQHALLAAKEIFGLDEAKVNTEIQDRKKFSSTSSELVKEMKAEEKDLKIQDQTTTASSSKQMPGYRPNGVHAPINGKGAGNLPHNYVPVPPSRRHNSHSSARSSHYPNAFPDPAERSPRGTPPALSADDAATLIRKSQRRERRDESH